MRRSHVKQPHEEITNFGVQLAPSSSSADACPCPKLLLDWLG
jgi:hypothetical protein